MLFAFPGPTRDNYGGSGGVCESFHVLEALTAQSSPVHVFKCSSSKVPSNCFKFMMKLALLKKQKASKVIRLANLS